MLSMFGRLFRTSECDPNTKSLSKNLCKTLGTSKRPIASAEQVQACLRAAILPFESPASTLETKSELLLSLLGSNVLVRMLEVHPVIEFETRKDIMRLFSHMLAVGTSAVFDYIRCRKQILQLLLSGCGQAEVALNSNIMLRSCTQHAEIVEVLLESGVAMEVLKLTKNSSFEISSDAFCSLRELLLEHKSISASYLETHFHEFFMVYRELLASQDYITRRQALRLLGEILRDEEFATVRDSYVSDDELLRIHMNLLLDDSRVMQLEAFRIFKIFVMRSAIAPRVHRILFKNRSKLVELLKSLNLRGIPVSSKDGEAFAEEKNFVIDYLLTLQA
jgi:calcium binding protein 39